LWISSRIVMGPMKLLALLLSAPALAFAGLPALASTPQTAPAIAAAAERPAQRSPVMTAIDTAAASQALGGLYAAHDSPVFTTIDGLSPRGAAVAATLDRAADYGLDAPAYARPQASAFTDATAQAAHEIAIAKAVLAYARDARGGRLPDPAKVSPTLDMKPRLPEPGAVLAAIASSDDGAAALQRFHPRHPGFRALQRAYAAERAAGAPMERLQRIEINLERWRWMPNDLGAFHVWNNVPEQLTRVVKAGDLIHTEKIVVGKPGHSTPVMSADMQYIIFHPSWGVPDGIKRNEIGPMLARASARNATFLDSFGFGENKTGRASSALARHQLRAFQNGREVNPDQVDWRTVDVRQFTFTQPPSTKNVLGVVKFRFPNKYDVYMHDTQEKHLFGHAVRAYSHGCMRVQNPLKLAGVLLGHDKGWSQAKVDAFVPGGRSADITLTTPIPVHLTYFTATADDAGKVTLHGDIYGMDARVGAALLGKPVALAAAKPASQPAASPRPVRTAAGTTPRVTTPAWNPFALSAN
jgi:murein L,D-transpeptidase YcbB/YkuD